MSSGMLESALRLWSRIAPTGRGGYRLVRGVRRRVPRQAWRRRFTLPSGLKMDLDLSVYPDCCMAYGLYELTTGRLIRRLLRPGDHFVDGGANIGYFTLLAAQRVGTRGHVDAFEPQPNNRARLIEHLKLNSLNDRVTVHDTALSDQEGQATIHFFPPDDDQHNHGCSTLFVEPADHTQATRVRTVRMDQVLHGSSPCLIKLDLEGAEPLAISGAQELLKSAAPYVIGELNPWRSKIAGMAGNEWVRRSLAIQPRYRLYVVGARLRHVPDPSRLPDNRDANLFLRADRP
ncbi:MAG: FkbM family methyltransferase [Phycisphaeraceae bacterium]